jgi:hypothetical protein
MNSVTNILSYIHDASKRLINNDAKKPEKKIYIPDNDSNKKKLRLRGNKTPKKGQKLELLDDDDKVFMFLHMLYQLLVTQSETNDNHIIHNEIVDMIYKISDMVFMSENSIKCELYYHLAAWHSNIVHITSFTKYWHIIFGNSNVWKERNDKKFYCVKDMKYYDVARKEETIHYACCSQYIHDIVNNEYTDPRLVQILILASIDKYYLATLWNTKLVKHELLSIIDERLPVMLQCYINNTSILYDNTLKQNIFNMQNIDGIKKYLHIESVFKKFDS